MTLLLKTNGSVLPRPSLPGQPPSLLLPRAMATWSEDTADVDLPAEESVRPGHELEAGDMDTCDVLVGGLILHCTQLRIAMPPEPGRFITGRVAVPVLWNAPNIWMEAATERG